ncbi:MAG: ABC transporter permease [Bifidobacteriaceae bacterium]|jgi:ABC-2 type transport system permease protein|nr:ABC transporter permease [Bifidobacteriaceae bacterium]
MTTAFMAAPVERQYQSRVGHKLTFAGIVKSEWIKIRSLRSTWWCGLLMVVLPIGFTALLVPSVVGSFDGGVNLPVGDDGYAVSVANNGLFAIGEVIAIVLGALAVTNEFGSGSIRSTLAAVPRRGPVLAAKAIVVALVTAAFAVVGLAGSLAVSAGVIAANGYTPQFGPDALKMAVGVVFYLVVTALVGLGLGFCLRSSAGAIASGIGLYLILPNVMMIGATKELVARAIELLPSQAGEWASRMTSMVNPEDPLLGGYWGAIACLAAWAAVALVGGYIVFKERDA